MKVKAIWNNQLLAESDKTEIVENNHYFPVESVNFDFLEPSSHHTTCPWKGEAGYYDIVVDGNRNTNAAWYYPHPKDAAKKIANHIAFWKGVKVIEE